MKRWMLSSAMAMLVAGCSFSADTKAAEQGVTEFHTALNNSSFDEIYTASAPDFKAASTRGEFTKLLGAIHTKLGNFQTGKTVGWNDNVNTGGHYVTLNREAQFERGPAQEQFVFTVSGETATLVGYHISSNALITG
jgi:hypothetical protein